MGTVSYPSPAVNVTTPFNNGCSVTLSPLASGSSRSCLQTPATVSSLDSSQSPGPSGRSSDVSRSTRTTIASLQTPSSVSSLSPALGSGVGSPSSQSSFQEGVYKTPP